MRYASLLSKAAAWPACAVVLGWGKLMRSAEEDGEGEEGAEGTECSE